jgi:ABC-type phosphate/phosphonate transport system substrate-binding protein
MRSRTILALLVCTFSVWAACASAKQYKFGVVIEPMTAAETALERKQAYERFVKSLSDRLQQPVTLVVLGDTGEEAQALEAGTIDMALLKVAFLAGQRIDYRTYFSQHRCYQNQHEMIKALKDGEIDAGTTFRPPHLRRNDDLRDLKVIARIPDIPNPVVAVSGSLSEEEKKSLTQALTQLPESAFQGLRF